MSQVYSPLSIRLSGQQRHRDLIIHRTGIYFRKGKVFSFEILYFSLFSSSIRLFFPFTLLFYSPYSFVSKWKHFLRRVFCLFLCIRSWAIWNSISERNNKNLPNLNAGKECKQFKRMKMCVFLLLGEAKIVSSIGKF